jgi:hypothetical protein
MLRAGFPVRVAEYYTTSCCEGENDRTESPYDEQTCFNVYIIYFIIFIRSRYEGFCCAISSWVGQNYIPKKDPAGIEIKGNYYPD